MGRLGNNLFQWAFLYTLTKEGVIPDWYLQNEMYFGKYRDEIKQALSEGIVKDTRVAIHVRRGDYVDNDFYVDLLKTDYYSRAMAEFPDKKFVVVSDDIEFCKGQDVFKDCDFSTNDSEEDDINLIASCAGQIISNSSFSWWGAFLSPHGGKVITPSVTNWHKDGFERTVCPPEWVRI